MVYYVIARFYELDEKLHEAIAKDDLLASAVDREIKSCLSELFSSKIKDMNEAFIKIEFLLELLSREIESTAVLNELRRTISTVFEMASNSEN